MGATLSPARPRWRIRVRESQRAPRTDAPSWPAVLAPGSSRAMRVAVALAAMLVFAVVYGQDALFSSNQNQYFVHGFASNGFGFLASDWFARTPDTMFAFSGLVRALDAIDIHLAYAVQAALLATYWYAIVGLGWCLFRLGTRVRLLSFMAVLLVLDSGLLDGRFPVRSLFADGVAVQETPGPYFQPSAFGVFLILSLYLFARRRLGWAMLAAAVAGIAHPTYLPWAALLSAIYAGCLLWGEHDRRRALLTFGGAVLLLAVPAAYIAANFRPTSDHAQALYVLVHVRQPYHALPDVWFDRYAAFRVALIAVALVTMRRTRLFPIFAALFGLSVALTLAQVATGSNELAGVFPWRISVVLVPVATAALVAFAVARSFDLLERRPRVALAATAAAAVCIAAVLAVRAGDQSDAFANTSPGPAKDLIAYVAKAKRPSDVYMVPVAQRNPLAAGVPLDPFRLRTGAREYVDWKSVPFSDRDTLEWFRRVRAVQSVYANGFRDCREVTALVRAGVTHAVVAHGQPAPRCAGDRAVYSDAHYLLYRLRG